MFEPRYIVDEHGNKTDIIIPYKDYIVIIEELEDLKAIEERKDDELVDHEDVKKMVEVHE